MKKTVSFYLSAVLLLLPLVITNGYYNITETKSALFYFLTGALFCTTIIITCITLLKKKDEITIQGYLTLLKNAKQRISFLDVAMLMFAFFTVLSAISSKHSVDAWFGINARYQGALTIIFYVLIYFIVSRNFNENSNFLLPALIALSIVCFIAVLNNFNIDVLGIYDIVPLEQKHKYISTIGNINFYSSYLCLLLPLIVCGFCQSKTAFSKGIYVIALIIGSCGMMVTGSDSFVLGFLFSMAVIPLFFSKDTEKLKNFFLSAIIIVVSLQVFKLVYTCAQKNNIVCNYEISLLLNILLNPFVSLVIAAICITGLILIKNKINIRCLMTIYSIALVLSVIFIIAGFLVINTVLYDNDVGVLGQFFKITPEWGTNRGMIWRFCIDLFKDFSIKDKLFGVGPETLQILSRNSVLFNGVLDQAHNEYLHMLLTIGILGVSSYAAVIAGACIIFIKKLKDNTLAVGLFAGLISYWVQATVNIAQPFSTPILYLYIAILEGICYNGRVFVSNS